MLVDSISLGIVFAAVIRLLDKIVGKISDYTVKEWIRRNIFKISEKQDAVEAIRNILAFAEATHYAAIKPIDDMAHAHKMGGVIRKYNNDLAQDIKMFLGYWEMHQSANKKDFPEKEVARAYENLNSYCNKIIDGINKLSK